MNLLPSEEQFNLILDALASYTPHYQNQIMNGEIIKAAQRVAGNAARSLDAMAFDESFAPKANPLSFVEDIKAELDIKATARLANKAAEEVTLLSAKIVQLREFCAGKDAEKAISELLD